VCSVRRLRANLKVGLTLLICGGAIACTCGAFDIDIGGLFHRLLRAVGIEIPERRSETIVDAGSQLSVAGSKVTVMPLTPDEVARRLSWAGIYQKDGWLAFRGEPLSKVVIELNRHNKRQLKIGDPQTGRLQVGGKFRVTDVDGFVAALGITHGVKATHSGPPGREDDVIVLTGGSSESEGSDEIVDPPPLE
jgi:hypothetical protein